MRQGGQRLMALFILGMIGGFSFAEQAVGTDPNLPVILSDYLYQAAMNNSGLKAAFESWRAAIEQVPQAAALDDPKFSFSYFVREETKHSDSPREQDYTITQMFPWFGKLEARTDAAAAQAQAARHRYEAARIKLVYQTSSVFYEFAYLAKAVDVAKDNLELMKHFERVAREKYRTAGGSHPDIVRAQIELATMADDLISMTRMRKPIVAQLNAVMNQPTDRDLPWPKQEEIKPVEIKPDVIAGQIHSANPELSAMSQQILASRKMEDLARKRYWPDVELGIEIDNMPNKGSGMQNPIMPMVSINLPIWVDSYNAGVKQAQAMTAMAQREKKQAEFDLVAQAEQVLFELDDNLRKIRLYENVLIPKAKEMIDVSEQAYRTNMIDFMSLIDAQQKLLSFQLMHERVMANYLQKQAELEMLTGQPLTAGQKQR
jgi:cobalt-zinc-cadmium efflux system outer membrane protein